MFPFKLRSYKRNEENKSKTRQVTRVKKKKKTRSNWKEGLPRHSSG